MLQALFTDWVQLEQDAKWSFGWLTEDQMSQFALVYLSLGLASTGSSLILFPTFFPAPRVDEVDTRGKQLPLRVPRRLALQRRSHQLGAVDAVYMALNTLCLPGLFYHFVCLMRSWGFDPGAPPLFGVYPPTVGGVVCETVPQLATLLPLYFVGYELVYYWWHRALHSVPLLYTYVHRHHHQTTYPQRGLADTLDTSPVESQIGLYLQLGTLYAYGAVGGEAFQSLPAAIWFFTIAGALSVLSHSDEAREAPAGLWRADEHHAHHALVRCNYAPYSTLWDRALGTFRPLETPHATKGQATNVTPRAAPRAAPLAPPSHEEEMAWLSELIWTRHHLRAEASEELALVLPTTASAEDMPEADDDAPIVMDDTAANDATTADDEPSGNNRQNGYCNDDDEECLLEEEQSGDLLKVDTLVRTRGTAVAYASVIATALFALAAHLQAD